MKTREGFVSNSSSTIFVVTNKTPEMLSVGEFVRETAGQMAAGWKAEMDDNVNVEELTARIVQQSKRLNKDKLSPGGNEVEFGDHGGPYADTLIGEIYDYMARDGGETKRFKWRFEEFNR